MPPDRVGQPVGVHQAQAGLVAGGLVAGVLDQAEELVLQRQVRGGDPQLLAEAHPPLGVGLEVVAVGVELELGLDRQAQLAGDLRRDAEGPAFGLEENRQPRPTAALRLRLTAAGTSGSLRKRS
jgi:hypothetical protein